MPKALSPAVMRRLDRKAIRVFKIPGLLLMENAGRGVAERVFAHIRKIKHSKVLIVCGTGNNGGDGFVTARHLKNRGVQTKIFLVSPARKLTPDAMVNFKIARKMKIPILSPEKFSAPLLSKADLIVDAIFGTGLSRNVEGKVAQIINAINLSGRPVVAVDIPSGLNGETGKVMGAAVLAKETVALGAAKKGFYENFGPRCCGRVTVADISIPRELLE